MKYKNNMKPESINWLELLNKEKILSIIKLGMSNANVPKDITPEDIYEAIGESYVNEPYDYFDTVENDLEETIKDCEEFFDVTIEDYKNLIGKCFQDGNIALKVVGVREDYDNEYYEVDNLKAEFLYEKFEQYNDEWHVPDYIWLQSMAKGQYADKKYLKFCITPYTEMNIGSEDMYHLGKDGNLYIDVYCSGEYRKIENIENETFEDIRKKAIENELQDN